MNTIIHLTTFLQGGAGKLICELIAHQQMSGNRVLCVCNNESYPGYQNYPEYEQYLHELGVPLIKLPGLFKRDQKAQSQAVQLFKTLLHELTVNETIYVIHTHAAIPAEVARQVRHQLALSFPVINTMHGWGTNKTEQQERQDIQILSRLDAVVAVSESAAKLLQNKGLNQDYLCTIYNGVAMQGHAQPEPAMPEHWYRQEDASIFRIVCLGSVCERKNQYVLLEAIAQLRSTGVNLVCVLIGEQDDAYAQQLASYAQRHGLADCLVMNGALEHADRYLSFFDVMVLPTRAEGMPMAILEAFREKILVLSSDIEACRELIEDGQNGFLFESDDARSLCNQLLLIRELQNEQRNAIVSRAYQGLIRRFTQETMLRAYDELYRKLSENVDVELGQTITSRTQ